MLLFSSLLFSLSDQSEELVASFDLKQVDSSTYISRGDVLEVKKFSKIHGRTWISDVTCSNAQRHRLGTILQEVDRWCQLAMRGSNRHWPFDRGEFRRYFTSVRYSSANLRQIVQDHYSYIRDEINERIGFARVRLSCNYPQQACARHRREALLVREDGASITVVE